MFVLIRAKFSVFHIYSVVNVNNMYRNDWFLSPSVCLGVAKDSSCHIKLTSPNLNTYCRTNDYDLIASASSIDELIATYPELLI